MGQTYLCKHMLNYRLILTIEVCRYLGVILGNFTGHRITKYGGSRREPSMIIVVTQHHLHRIKRTNFLFAVLAIWLLNRLTDK